MMESRFSAFNQAERKLIATAITLMAVESLGRLPVDKLEVVLAQTSDLMDEMMRAEGLDPDDLKKTYADFNKRIAGRRKGGNGSS